MTRPRLLVPTLFLALAIAAIAAGCSGGGGSVPTSPGAPTGTAAHRRAPVGAVLRIHIPRKHKHRGRGAAYVSPNMLALTVAVQQVTASPWPALPLQTLVVNTPQPCVPAGGGLNCTFTVKAYVGKNVFTFNEYATKNPKPQDTPLGTLTTGAEKVTSGGSGLNFTLDGVVNQIELVGSKSRIEFRPRVEKHRGDTNRYGDDVPALRQPRRRERRLNRDRHVFVAGNDSSVAGELGRFARAGRALYWRHRDADDSHAELREGSQQCDDRVRRRGHANRGETRTWMAQRWPHRRSSLRRRRSRRALRSRATCLRTNSLPRRADRIPTSIRRTSRSTR